VSSVECSGSGVQESRVQGLGFEAHHLQATVLGGGTPSRDLHRTPRPRRPTKDNMTLHVLSLTPKVIPSGGPARPPMAGGPESAHALGAVRHTTNGSDPVARLAKP